MNLQLLDFDCSEDAEGVVCWDALAQPLPRYNTALLQEVAQVLAWAHAFDAPGPGPLEDGACWDFDLQVRLLHEGQAVPSTSIRFVALAANGHEKRSEDPKPHLQLDPAPGPQQRMSLSLSLSGTPGFAEAFRAQFDLP
jgi:hypothetical protein